MKTKLIGIAAAAAVALGMAGNAHAFTAGIIDATNDFNSGVDNIYGTNTRAGYYGANVYLLASGPITLTISFLGREAGYNNTFNWGTLAAFTQLFANTQIGQDAWDADGTDGAGPWPNPIDVVANPGLLTFFFGTNNGVGQSAVNGLNPDNTVVNDVNFFVTFVHDPLATSGQAIDLWLDDGNSSDDNHDDMAIRIAIKGGDGNFVVPIPAAAWLLGSGLLGLFGIARRRNVTAA